MSGIVPVIDISAIRGADLAARQAPAAQLGAARRGPGFFLVTGHGRPGCRTGPGNPPRPAPVTGAGHLPAKLDGTHAHRREPG